MARKSGKTAPFLWGAAAGAIALAGVGFSLGGWMTGYTTEALAAASADEAVVASLTPICVAQFRRDPRAWSSLTAIKAIDRWQRADFVSRNGWATMPGSTQGPNPAVASACADVLVGSSA